MEGRTNDRAVVPDNLNDAMCQRMSIGYFMHPNFDAEMSCIPSCLASGAEPHYPPITAGEHIRQKIDRSHRKPG